MNNNSQHTDIPGNVSGRTGEFTYIGMNEDNAQIPMKSTLSPGTTYNLKISVKRADSGLWTTSNNYQFTTTPIATLTNTSIDFNIGQDLILTFKDYENNKSYLALDVQKEDETWEEVATVDEVLQMETFTWELSSIASILYSKVVTRNRANIRIRCGTTIDDEKYYQTLTGIMSVVNSDPQFSNFSYGDANTVTQKVLGNTSYMPEKLGNMQAHISVANKAVALNQAYIVQYIANIIDSSGKVILTSNIPYSSTNQIDFIFGSLSTADTYTINIYAIDSRGNTSQTVTKTFRVLPYHSPVSNIVLRRLNNYEEETTISIRSQYSKLVVGNTNKNDSFNIKYRYGEIGKDLPTTYTTITGLVSSSLNSTDMVVTFSANPFVNLKDQSNKSFNFEFQIIDKIGTILETVIVEQGVPLTFQSETGHLSVGMLPEWDSPAKFQVASDILATDKDGTKKLVLEEISKINNDLFERYHVGSLIFDTVNINPQTYLHFGVWELWGQGKMPIGIDETDEDFDISEKTGGEKTHTLTIDEMPSHNHGIRTNHGDGTLTTAEALNCTLVYGNVRLDRIRSNLYGGNQAHNNLPPYIVCYIWKRVN